jgi:hypothetical protein
MLKVIRSHFRLSTPIPCFKNEFSLVKKGAFFGRSFFPAQLCFLTFGAFVALRAIFFRVKMHYFFARDQKVFIFADPIGVNILNIKVLKKR